MSFARALGLAFTVGVLGACAGPRLDPVDDEPSRPRMIAEWEPAVGTLVTWPFRIPESLVVDLAAEARLFVLVGDDDARAVASARLAELGVAEDRVECVTSSARTQWTRDWGPSQLVDADGRRAFVDHVFKGYPWAAADATVAELEYFQTPPGDDLAAGELAAYFGAERVDVPAILTGGNFLVDGRRRAFCTRALLVENEPLVDEAGLRALIRERLGIDELIVMENTEPYGIQHIDCWLKLLDEETLLVKRVPDDHAEHGPIERNVERLAALRAPSGQPYRIVRIDCPRYRGEDTAAYTNALILNGVVHVPLFGIEADQRALATYAAAAPDLEVRGYRYRGWMHFDALHCRTRAVFREP